MVYDLVTPVPADGQGSQILGHQRRAPHQPQDFREGVANAYDVVTAVSTTCTCVQCKTCSYMKNLVMVGPDKPTCTYSCRV